MKAITHVNGIKVDLEGEPEEIARLLKQLLPTLELVPEPSFPMPGPSWPWDQDGPYIPPYIPSTPYPSNPWIRPDISWGPTCQLERSTFFLSSMATDNP